MLQAEFKGHPHGSLEGETVDRSTKSGGLAHEVQRLYTELDSRPFQLHFDKEFV